MAAEMPARVEPIEGAVRVDYPWAAATTAVSALDDVASALESQLGQRAGMLPELVEWEGAYYGDFSTKRWLLEFNGTGLKQEALSLASSIVSGAEDANAQQRQNNERAEVLNAQ